MAFLVFCYDVRYPQGGWHDFIGQDTSLTAATNRANRAYATFVGDAVHVVDTITGLIVFQRQNTTRPPREPR